MRKKIHIHTHIYIYSLAYYIDGLINESDLYVEFGVWCLQNKETTEGGGR